jgi:hypothetical protein
MAGDYISTMKIPLNNQRGIPSPILNKPIAL